MNADSVYRIGSGHKVCQDYALHDAEKGSCAIVADGCSSSPNTDLGARILAHQAKKQIFRIGLHDSEEEIIDRIEDFFDTVIANSRWCVKENFNSAFSCLDATLLIARSDGIRFLLACYGDGIFAAVRADGTGLFQDVEYGNNAPLYLNYHKNEARIEAYNLIQNNERTITEFNFDSGASPFIYNVKQDKFNFLVGNCEHFQSVAVLSDGAGTFVKKGEMRNLPREQVIGDLMAFRSPAGEFVQRRMNGMLKEKEKQGYNHYDDLSMAAIWFGIKTLYEGEKNDTHNF